MDRETVIGFIITLVLVLFFGGWAFDRFTGESAEGTAVVIGHLYDGESTTLLPIYNGKTTTYIPQTDDADYLLDIKLPDGSVRTVEVDQSYWYQTADGTTVRVAWTFGHWTRYLYGFRIVK